MGDDDNLELAEFDSGMDIPAEPAAEPVQTASVSAGGALVQIGAFDSDSVAQSEWNRLSGKFGSLFSGKGQVIQEHKSNDSLQMHL